MAFENLKVTSRKANPHAKRLTEMHDDYVIVTVNDGLNKV